MNYKVIYYNKWRRPYFYSEPSEICDTESIETYTVMSIELCKQIVKDFLDVPVAELSLDEIHKDFDIGNEAISESKALAIQTYYNGRLALYNTILEDLNNCKSKNTLHYDIPENYNKFSTEDDENEKNTKQLQAFIDIQLLKD